MLFSRVRGLPVPAPGGREPARHRAGADGRPGVRHGHPRADTERAPAQGDRAGLGRPGRRRPGHADRPPSSTSAEPPPHHDLLGSRVLTEDGEERGTVLDAAFDPLTTRIEAVLTTRGELPADRLLGLGDHALVIRARGAGPRTPAPHV
ncbi:PRC-barrel domain-containing protein (plasmid) [Streptomyces sp. GDS52]|uniref:PRC-barrel domain-containing protein n=1 Tax=Streptomyces sp. GDS52 TaxID=3406419 RepID=UPI003FD3F016